MSENFLPDPQLADVSPEAFPDPKQTVPNQSDSRQPDLKQPDPARQADPVWKMVCRVSDIPPDGGGCVSLGDEQIAIFHFSRRGQWYATQNECPHRHQMALSRGMTGSVGEKCEPKIACPFHKKTFSLTTGDCLSGEEYKIRTYPVRVKNGKVYIGTEK
ncbi:MAG: nitrite reductase small subunit NirD [Puia sp.]|nr:nitrite reductase small subunit NirD [Puia sp.]